MQAGIKYLPFLILLQKIKSTYPFVSLPSQTTIANE